MMPTFLWLLLCLTFVEAAAQIEAKPRTIVTTDGEIDDVDSFIRMLLYANEFKLEGLVYSSSMWHFKGDGQGTKMVSEMEMTRKLYGEIADLRWPGEQWMQDLIGAYARVYPTLSTHAAGYPTPEALLEMIRVGNITFEGEMEENTPGAALIMEKLLDADPAPIYLQAWGGTNTIARALQMIEEAYRDTPAWPAVQNWVNAKAIIYTIMDQDATLRKYITPNWPGITVYYNAGQFWALAYGWKKAVPAHLHPYLEGAFMGEHIINGHGPLTKMYYSYGDEQRQAGDPEHIHGDPTKLKDAQWGTFGKYDFISEGDSPAFLHLIDVGLGNLEHPEYGGWGGRLAPSTKVPHRYEDGATVAEYANGKLDNGYAQVRWIEALQKDFAARADWCVLPYDQANHPPEIILEGAAERKVRGGQRIPLRATVTDPDGDELTVQWWEYAAAGTYGPREREDVVLEDTEYRVPEDIGPGQTIHLIAQVTDGGTPELTRYQRLVLVGE
ncbi:DUF1593 domain-containing protein [Neolewinella lacunae]|nr:DUF1593 domain-containing protein [Neolewinella lacunae]MDN3633221.1 DUF1593 domain-containing protein [Neolewinella lacunae]